MSLDQEYIEKLSVDSYIGERVHLWLRRRGHSQVELSEYLGMTQASVSRKMKGKTAWTATNIYHVAQFLQVSVSELFPSENAYRLDVETASESLDPKAEFHLVAGAGFEPTTSGL
ncbi:helix-turn-helix domain-containing protein [Trueperella sp. LYQ143]|uniref:helix-turn-helix domain-containing protein n=1 Tax=Trueperella sp. LYQ143 TaxID=3391059 RepID=UPI003983AA96